MNNTKFTPGPWRIDRETRHDCGYSRSSRGIVDPDGKPVLLFDPSDGEYNPAIDEDSADVHLIAAAPELYQALVLAKDMMVANDCSLPKTFEVIDAALSKARGEA